VVGTLLGILRPHTVSGGDTIARCPGYLPHPIANTTKEENKLLIFIYQPISYINVRSNTMQKIGNAEHLPPPIFEIMEL
jgi:hypothetical protein